MRKKKILTLVMTGVMLSAVVTGCSKPVTTQSDSANITTDSATINTTQGLDLSDYATNWVYNEEYNVYMLENVVYCANPVNTQLQSMNIYVPAAYMNADGSLINDGAITNSNGATYTSQTAPIVYSNGVWGYSEAKPATIDGTSAEYTNEGYILICVGSRGKESVNEDGSYIGKAPDGLVDLKAGIRYLKYNDDKLAGNSERIISVGLSAGGAMSALLGTTGNSDDFTPYLEEIGAAMSATDDIYGTMAYCPITNLENSDMTYEWMFTSDTNYSASAGARRNADTDSTSNDETKNGQMSENKGNLEGNRGDLTAEEAQSMRGEQGGSSKGSGEETELTEFQKVLSTDLAALYPAYINSLNLGLTLGDDGRSGTYYEGMMEVISDALNTYLQSEFSTVDEKLEYISSLNTEDEWVSFDTSTQKASINDLDLFVQYYLGRQKAVPGFDALDLTAQENQLFGSSDSNLSHFSLSIAQLFRDNDYSALEGYDESLVTSYNSVITDSSLQENVALMNPLNAIGSNEETTISPYFRIRVGTKDADSAFATAFTLSTALSNKGINVDYAMLWGQGHRIMEMNGEFVDWIDEICNE